MKPELYIGLSLSACVAEIANKHVPEGQVIALIASTDVEDVDEFENLLQRYKEIYWDHNEECVLVARRLWRKGLIIQPRRAKRPIHALTQGHWRKVPSWQ